MNLPGRKWFKKGANRGVHASTPIFKAKQEYFVPSAQPDNWEACTLPLSYTRLCDYG